MGLGALGPWGLGALGLWGLGALGPWGLGALGPWGLGALGPWGLGALGPWGLGDLGTWGLGDLGTWGLGGFGASPSPTLSVYRPLPKMENAFLETCYGYIVSYEQVLHFTLEEGFHDELAKYKFVHPKSDLLSDHVTLESLTDRMADSNNCQEYYHLIAGR